MDPLAAVLELLVVGGGVVPALGGAVGGEGDRAAGARVDVALDPGHHRVLGTWHNTGVGQGSVVTCHVSRVLGKAAVENWTTKRNESECIREK